MKIFDCFPFFNEFEILELRFQELYDTVDYFVIAEANQSHNGTPKPYYLEENKERFKQWWDKVIYVRVDDMPEYHMEDVFRLEYHQRNSLMRGLTNLAKPGDKILLSDCDEIPNVETLRANLDCHEMRTFKQTLFYYYVNNACLGSWCGTTMAEWPLEKNRMQSLRWFAIKNRYQKYIPAVIRNGGWHYSYMTGGDAAKIRSKIALFAEKNLVDVAGSKEEVEYKINHSQDLYGRDNKGRHKQKIVDITNNKPKSLDKWLEKYPSFIYKGEQ
jgi:beta-1,4-mannosyl-glycoprotein beta-1,4-N-acetylglucosaminyltransferase